MKKLFLLCNAHIDPVWLWEYEEGVGCAITTYSAAADFLDEYEGFVFNHNESLIYEYVEEFAPALFEHIKKHVAAGRWHIMGGWFIQPDVNMPSGESIARQILKGQNYFKEKFGISPETAVNFDSFGHSKGLVQILQNAGYKGYVCCRPMEELFNRGFVWKGFNGSELLLYRMSDAYGFPMGLAGERIRKDIEKFKALENHIFFWGVGNHGGGPSRKDLDDIEQIKKEYPELEIKHAALSEYFDELEKRKKELPVIDKDLNYTLQGCYTSQIRIKQLHQQLENDLYAAEKMCAHASFYGAEYPAELLKRAERDLLFCEFHDILPGTSIPDAEEASIRMLNRGLANAADAKMKAFFKLTTGQERAADGEYPIFVYNPHPYETEAVIECEFQLADQNGSEEEVSSFKVYRNGNLIPSQLEKEASNLNLDWRKKLVFGAVLPPSSMSRFSCFNTFEKIKEIKKKENCGFVFKGKNKTVKIGVNSGLIESYVCGGREMLSAPSCGVEVIKGSGDPWGFKFNEYTERLGEFRLMTPEQVKAFISIPAGEYRPVMLIEDGPVRAVVQALFKYNESALAVMYKIPYEGSEITVDYILYNNENDTIFRSVYNTAFEGKLYGKTCFGVNELDCDGLEKTAQDYVVFEGGGYAMSLINYGNHGLRAKGNRLCYTLVHSPAYSGHPIGDRPLLPDDRYTPRIDRGERKFRFILDFGKAADIKEGIEYKTVTAKQFMKPLNFFPIKTEGEIKPFLICDNKRITVSALKRAEDGDGYILRVFNGAETAQTAKLGGGLLNGKPLAVKLKPMEFKSYRISGGKAKETNILEG